MIHYKSFGPRKINVIKELRALVPGLGLKEAKVLSENLGSNLPKDLFPTHLDEKAVVRRLRAAGAEVEHRQDDDPELQAMETIREELVALDERARRRVVQWTYDRFFVDLCS